MPKISGGPLSISGKLTFGKRGTTIPLANAFISAPDTDFGGVTYPIVLNSSLITSTGKYAIVYSPLPLYHYEGASVTWSGTPNGTATVTPAGEGDVVTIDGNTYYAVVVTVA